MLNIQQNQQKIGKKIKNKSKFEWRRLQNWVSKLLFKWNEEKKAANKWSELSWHGMRAIDSNSD